MLLYYLHKPIKTKKYEAKEAGNEGLRKAAIKYDASRGFKFIAYAVWWIRQSIIQAIEENNNE